MRSYSNPQESGTGQWLIEFRTGEAKVHIEMRYERKSEKRQPLQQPRLTLDPSLLSGLTREQAMSGGTHVQFQLRRDAGTFSFEGWFKKATIGPLYFCARPLIRRSVERASYGSPSDEAICFRSP